MFRRSRDLTMLPIVCLAADGAVCVRIQPWRRSHAGPPPPLAPMAGLPAQPPVVPNLNQQILGNWSASYPGGPYRVTIQTDPLLGRHQLHRHPHRWRLRDFFSRLDRI